MVIGGSAYIKKINRSIIIQKIIEHQLISRADLSKITGLNKATISVQVADLLEEDLVYETQQEHNTVGRRPIMLSINENAGVVLGIDLDYEKIIYSISNLKGVAIHTEEISLATDDYDEIIHMVINKIKDFQAVYSEKTYGIVNVVIGVHGTVNKETESIRFIPRYNWRNKNIKSDIEKHINIPVYIENNANLSAYAEKVYKHHHSEHLLNIILSSGIGSGTVVNNKLQRGFHGYAGEMGHMIIQPNGDACRCGNYGCWELYASEPRFLSNLAKELNRSSLQLTDIKELINSNHPTVISFLDRYIYDLSIGLNNIINLYNPETIVINSTLLNITPRAIEKLKENLVSSVSEYGDIVLSDLGNDASILGACALGLKRFLDVKDIKLTAPSPKQLV